MFAMKKAQNCDIAYSMLYCYGATLNHCISELMSKYSLDNSLLHVSCTVLKKQTWKHFVDASIVNGNLSAF